MNIRTFTLFLWIICPVYGFVGGINSFIAATTIHTPISSTTSIHSTTTDATTDASTDTSTTINPSPVVPINRGDVNSDLKSLLAGFRRRKSKSPIIDKISTMRRGRGQEDGEFEAYFDCMLDIIGMGADDTRPASFSKVIAVLPFPVHIPSYRVNLFLLRAVLSITGDSKPTQASRRQNLAITLNQLKNYRGGIKSLHRDAIRKGGAKVSMSEMLKRTPQGLETPSYSVIKSSASKMYEVREYDSYSVCSLIYKGGPRGFQSLAGYIFGKNKEEKAMAMTTPVFMGAEGDKKSMSFVMPSAYWGDDEKLKDEAPTPLDGTGIEKVQVGKETRVAMWYGGLSSPAAQKEKAGELMKAMEEDEEWEIVGGMEGMIVANYNDPFTSPWKRRNEVQFKVERRVVFGSIC